MNFELVWWILLSNDNLVKLRIVLIVQPEVGMRIYLEALLSVYDLPVTLAILILLAFFLLIIPSALLLAVLTTTLPSSAAPLISSLSPIFFLLFFRLIVWLSYIAKNNLRLVRFLFLHC